MVQVAYNPQVPSADDPPKVWPSLEPGTHITPVARARSVAGRRRSDVPKMNIYPFDLAGKPPSGRGGAVQVYQFPAKAEGRSWCARFQFLFH